MSIVSQTLRTNRDAEAQDERPELRIPHLLKNLHYSLRQVIDEAFRAHKMDLSLAQFVVLLALDGEPGIAGAALARRAFVTAQSMNTILRRMERDGDIERQPHPEKARTDSWFVTRVGKSRLTRARSIAEAVWMRMFSALKPAETKQMEGILERCISGLDLQLNGTRTATSRKSQVSAPGSKARRA